MESETETETVQRTRPTQVQHIQVIHAPEAPFERFEMAGRQAKATVTLCTLAFSVLLRPGPCECVVRGRVLLHLHTGHTPPTPPPRVKVVQLVTVKNL